MLRIYFFQAEDGIRDLTVTGVQTCALPISKAPACVAMSAPPRSTSPSSSYGSLPRGQPTRLSASSGVPPIAYTSENARSEERRVGKSVAVGGAGTVEKKIR